MSDQDEIMQPGGMPIKSGWPSFADELAKAAAYDALKAENERLRDVLSSLSSWLGYGLGDDKTTPAEYEQRIRDGVDMHINVQYKIRLDSIMLVFEEMERCLAELVRTAYPVCIPGERAAMEAITVLERAKKLRQSDQ